MGCVCSSGVDSDDRDGEPQEVKSSKQLKRLVVSSKNNDEVLVGDTNGRCNIDSGRERLISNSEENTIAPTTNLLNGAEKDAVAVFDGIQGGGAGQQRGAGPSSRATHEEKISSGISVVPNGFDGLHVAAGWPLWLMEVAAEAVQGWLPRRAESFERLSKIGQGTYSSVYKARDLDNGKIVALKKVRFTSIDSESVRFMAREIYILRRLDHPNVLKLEGLIASQTSCSLYLVFEYMEHDLAGLAATPGIKFTEPQVKCYMQQLLSGLYHCHSRGVLHRDIKGSNLLIDNNGILKIADFGLSVFFNPNQKQPMTSRVVTLWYRPPELLLGATQYGVSVDLWSTGCILAELLAGKPIMPGRTEIDDDEKVTMIDFPQMVSISHRNAKMYFDRDVECIFKFFGKRFNLSLEEGNDDCEGSGSETEENGRPSFSAVVRSTGFLDKELAASGFTRKDQDEIEKCRIV